MAAIVQKVGIAMIKKTVGKEMADTMSGGNDPYYIYSTDHRGKVKKVWRTAPTWVPEHDAKILDRVRTRAYRLDAKHSFLGVKFGWTALIGLFPIIGDSADSLLAYRGFRKCSKVSCGLDKKTESAMIGLIFLDGGIGLIPVVGDIMDTLIKPNTRILILLMKRLDDVYMPEEERERRAAAKQSRWGFGRKSQKNGRSDSARPRRDDPPPPAYEQPDHRYDDRNYRDRRPDDRMAGDNRRDYQKQRPANGKVQDGQPRKRFWSRNDSQIQRNGAEMSQMNNPPLPQRPM